MDDEILVQELQNIKERCDKVFQNDPKAMDIIMECGRVFKERNMTLNLDGITQAFSKTKNITTERKI